MALANQLVSKMIMMNIKTVYNAINLFLQTKGLRSENTSVAYEIDIRQFFRVTRGMELEELTWNEIEFEHTEVVQYQMHLVNSGLSNSTINRKMTSVHSLFKFLKRDHQDINVDAFKVDKLSESRKNSYGVLTLDECWQMIELVKKQYKGEEKALLIELAMATSIRKEALLSLKWEDITYNKQYNVWVVNVIDKGDKKDEKPIPDELYQKLLVLKHHRKASDGYVFHLDSKTPDAMMEVLCKEMGIPEERNIVFHSIKKITINYSLDVLKDVKKATEQGNHASMDTMYKYYAKKEKDFANMPGLMIYQQPNEDALENMSKEDLLVLIKSTSAGTKYEILAKAKKGVK